MLINSGIYSKNDILQVLEEYHYPIARAAAEV
jgi:hypothetical protein